MTSALLRVILGPDSSQRVVFPDGLPSTVPELESEIKLQCKLINPFRLQFMDSVFGNDFINLTSMVEIQDKSTLKVVHIGQDTPNTDAASCSSAYPEDTISSGDSTVILSSPESTTSRSSWPDVFFVPRFSYDAELKLEGANKAYLEKGELLDPDPKLRSDILSGLLQEIVKHKVYVTDREVDQVAEALIMKHPCLCEKGSARGYKGWKVSLKYKMSNYRRHLRNAGCPEVCVNALKHKPDGKCCPAFGVKKPKRGEVSYLPPFPLGDCEQSLEKIRVELLTDVSIRSNRETVKVKMEKTFALRRQEVIWDAPMVSELLERWPALFTPVEINAEFKRVTTMHLQSWFLSQLDLLTPNILKVFGRHSSHHGKKLKELAANIPDDTDSGRETIIKGLCIYLNEEYEALVQEYKDMNVEILRAIEETTVGIYVTREAPMLEYSDVGIILEGEVVLRGLDNVALATAMLLGLFYALNLSYPSKLRYTFEVMQKIIMELEATELSRKAQTLKTKMYQ